MKVNPFHTVTPEKEHPGHRDVFHDQNNCPDGLRIKPENKRSGAGNRLKCDWCKVR